MWLTENPEPRAVSCETLVVDGFYNMGGEEFSLTKDLPVECRSPNYLNILPQIRWGLIEYKEAILQI